MRTLLLSALLTAPVLADDSVAVPGSDARFVPKVVQTINGHATELNITGTALRTKYGFKVYSMASYLQNGVKVTTAEELAKADAVKLFHMVMERKASGSDFVDAFRNAVGSDRAKKDFANEFAKLQEAVGSATAHKGDTVILRYTPKEGTRVRIGDTVDVTIAGESFGQAIWETFLGPNPIDKDIKKNLMSQVK